MTKHAQGAKRALNAVATTADKNVASAQSPLSRLKEILEYVDTQKSNVDLTDEEFFAEVLHIKKYSQAEFKDKYSNNEFQKHILSKKIDEKDSVFEIFINIPEMTGMLPFPDFKKIKEARDLLDAPTQDNVTPSAKSTILLAQKELIKIERYPRAFFVGQAHGLTTYKNENGDICKVKVPKENNRFFPSYHYFMFVNKSTSIGVSSQ